MRGTGPALALSASIGGLPAALNLDSTRTAMAHQEGQETFDLARFALSDMIECGSRLRTIGAGAGSMEEVADLTVRYLYDHLREGEEGDRCCALVRFFKTHGYADLEPPLQTWAAEVLEGAPVAPGMKCMTLLATAGEDAAWNSRHQSRGHRAIPLPSERVVSRIPMMAQLIRQFGVPISALVEPDPELVGELGMESYSVFHVAEARGSAYIPDQESFVGPYGIRSVLGFGGMLPSGDLFAVILFSRVPISEQTARLFETIALNVKIPLLAFPTDRTFAEYRAG